MAAIGVFVIVIRGSQQKQTPLTTQGIPSDTNVEDVETSGQLAIEEDENTLVANLEDVTKGNSTGVMDNNTFGNYSLNFQSDMEYDGYNFVVITLETIKDATPEKHILEGTAL